jgi:hypothetical protein
VIVGGFADAATGDHPFRKTAMLLAGPRGLIVSPASLASSGTTSAILAMWRPCMAYLAVVVAIALPALVGAL